MDREAATTTVCRRILAPLVLCVASLTSFTADAVTTLAKRYEVREIDFDHANASDWGGTNAGPYKEFDCRAELSAAPGAATATARVVPGTDGGNNTAKIPLFYDGIVGTGAAGRYRWKLRIAGNTGGTYRYKIACHCSLVATRDPAYCATRPSFHDTQHTHIVESAATPEMARHTWEGRGWLITDGARFFRYDRKDLPGNPENRTILNGIFATGASLGASQFNKGEKRAIGYEEADIDRLTAAAGQNDFNAIVLEVYRGWADDPAVVNKNAGGAEDPSANLETYLCKSPETCGSNLSDCGCRDKLHPFEDQGRDKSRIVPAYWQSLDVRLEKIALATAPERRSLTAALKLGQNTCLGGTQGFGTSSGLPHAAFKHFLLYLIGRYGAYNILWMGHQEADEMPCHTTAYIAAYLDWIHRNDPYFRVASNHKASHTARGFDAYTNDDAWSTGPISPDFLAVQETDRFGRSGNVNEAGGDDATAWDHAQSAGWGTNIPGLRANPKPWVNAEYGFERRVGDDHRNQADQIDLDLLEDIWGGMLGGAAGMFYGNNWFKPGNRSTLDTERLDDPGFEQYHRNLYRFFQDTGADVRYWEWNAYKKVPIGATAYTLSCRRNHSCALSFFKAINQNIDMTGKGPDDPAFAFGSTVYLRWYDVRRACWEAAGTTAVTAGPGSNITRPGSAPGDDDRWLAVMRKDVPYGTLSPACSDRPEPLPTAPPAPPQEPPAPPLIVEARPLHRKLRCNRSACRVLIECVVIEGPGAPCRNRFAVLVRKSALRSPGEAPAKGTRRMRFAAGSAEIPAGMTMPVRLRRLERGRHTARTRLRDVLEIRTDRGDAVLGKTPVVLRLRRR